MKLIDVLNITPNTVKVHAPAYNKNGEVYKEKTLEIGWYSRYYEPEDNILQAKVVEIMAYDTDNIFVIVDL